MSDTTTSKIAEFNDRFRKSTRSVDSLGKIAERVASFDSFTDDNDPHGEQDFSALEHDGKRYSGKSTTTTGRASAPGATLDDLGADRSLISIPLA
jgi:hypothetical protein